MYRVERMVNMAGYITAPHIVDVTFTSVWDGDGFDTKAKYNLITKEVTDIETVDIDNSYNSCDRQYITLQDSTELEVTEDSDGYYAGEDE